MLSCLAGLVICLLVAGFPFIVSGISMNLLNLPIELFAVFLVFLVFFCKN